MSETFRLTERRINLGILSAELQERYDQLNRAAKLVESIKAKHPEDYVDVVKNMVAQVNAQTETGEKEPRSRNTRADQTANL